MPGGHVEWGETLHEAVVRETYEETGLEVVVDRFLGWVERIEDPYHFVILDFAVTVLDPSTTAGGGRRRRRGGVGAVRRRVRLRLVAGLYEFLRDVEVW